MTLSREDILNADDINREVVEVPEWGGSVIVQSMSAAARDRWEMSLMDEKGNQKIENIRASLVASCLVDEKGELLFSIKDVQKLGKKSAKVLDRLFSVAQKVSGVGQDDVEELAKN